MANPKEPRLMVTGVVWMDKSNVTEQEVRELAAKLGAEFLPGPHLMTYDVIGGDPRLVPSLEAYRVVGVLFRYFKTHQDRLSDFQLRIDALRHRIGS